jgi:multidrug efflux pump
MAIAIMGGLASGTVLTIFFVPALYAAWFRIRRQPRDSAETQPIAAEPAPAS